ncbi:unnamed protein product [Somion occarium]|uniref:RRM domain-containing protein n=1 Tax=Somion occarium TaxID=3059160 RepID=A0ABP1D306_9APHY
MQLPPFLPHSLLQTLIMSGRSLYLGGLPDAVKEDDIRRHLSIYGKINTIHIFPGYGFVEFESETDAVASLANQLFLGYEMSIQLARHRRKTVGSDERNTTRTEGSPPVRERSRTTSSHSSEYQARTRYPVTVHNLDRQTCWQELKDFGRLAGGTVVFCQVDKINRGRGLIEYLTQEDADRAVKELNGRTLHDRVLSLYIHATRRPYDHFRRASPAPIPPKNCHRRQPYPQPRSRQSTVDSAYSPRGRTLTNEQNLSPVKRVENYSPNRPTVYPPKEAVRVGSGESLYDRIHYQQAERPQAADDRYRDYDRRNYG